MEHERIMVVQDDIFCYGDNYGEPDEKIGICRFKNVGNTINIEDNGFILFTEPIEGYVFAVKEDLFYKKVCENWKEDGLCEVLFFDLNKPNKKPICAISCIDINEIMDMIADGDLRINIVDWEDGLSRIGVSNHRIFNKNFLDIINPQPQFSDNDLPYWFTDSKHPLKIREYEDESENYRDYDPQDDWWAMTDGHYGDEPDGFDGDYSFLGH